MAGKTRIHRQRLIVVLAATVGLAIYLGAAWRSGYVGFPLDDAWIHQTYARNLVEYGEWAFVPGQPSAGSTSPLWTLGLALGYVLRVPFRAWAYALGGLCLAGTAVAAYRLASRLFPDRPAAPLLAGLACALEWHLVWAAASGMETLLFALLALAVWNRVLADPRPNPFVTGLLGGALILARPEGATVVGLAALGLLLTTVQRGGWRARPSDAALLGVGTVLVVAPYLALNVHLSGTPWPNTFYAKQAEYAVHRLQPLMVRLWQVGTTPWIGAQVLLLPGLVWLLWRRARGRPPSHASWRLPAWLPVIWGAATVLIYALRLPVTYQHGRYLIPIIPVLLVYGVGGTLDLVQATHGRTIPRLLGRTLLLAAAVLLPTFCALVGAPAYATDVAIIEEEMVAVARWLETHTDDDALVAAHDIGAIGYFSPRPLLDMAGLVSPEVVPFIRDEDTLLAWLEARGADYLVTFPSWYRVITADPRLEEVFRTAAEITVAQGGDNMAIYRPHW
jgi:hypothetical protein